MRANVCALANVSKYVNGFMHLEIKVHCCNAAGKFFAQKHFLTGCKYEICVLFGALRRTEVSMRLPQVGTGNVKSQNHFLACHRPTASASSSCKRPTRRRMSSCSSR